MTLASLLAGIAFDPEIRGFLAVLTGVLVLMGSIWLILSTNSGYRVGTMLAFAGFFGWMSIMGSVWWLYGIGWVGDAPSWELEEINVGDLDQSRLDAARVLPNSADLPSAYELTISSGNEIALAEYGPVTPETLLPDATEGLTPAEVEELAATLQRRHEATTLSELAAATPEVINEAEDAGTLNLNGWTLLSTAESGEAVASATAFLGESELAGLIGGDSVATAVKVLDSYTEGGKPGLPDNPNRFDRIAHQVTSALRFGHPVRYAVVQVQQVIPQETEPGQPPPLPVVDPERPVISVVLVRNLGNLRVQPGLLTLGSMLIFGGLCYLLHERDKELMERRAAFEKAA